MNELFPISLFSMTLSQVNGLWTFCFFEKYFVQTRRVIRHGAYGAWPMRRERLPSSGRGPPVRERFESVWANENGGTPIRRGRPLSRNVRWAAFRRDLRREYMLPSHGVVVTNEWMSGKEAKWTPTVRPANVRYVVLIDRVWSYTRR